MERSVRFNIPDAENDDQEFEWVQYSGTREADLTVKQRKLIRIFAYLGMNVYLYLNGQKEDASRLYRSLHLLRLRQNDSRNSTIEFCRINDDRMQIEQRSINEITERMVVIWNYLFDLAINFENIHPDGTEFIKRLVEVDDADAGDDVTPIADISVGSSFEDS